MRVRQWAVVGAVVATAWMGSTGVAQATDEGTPIDAGCGLEELTSADGGWVPPAPIPCHPEDYPAADAFAQVGCTGSAVLFVEVTDLEPGDEVTLVADSRTRSDVVEADEDGVADLTVEFTPNATGSVFYDVEYADGNIAASDDVEIENTCQGSAGVTAVRDCATPETVTFTLTATGLESDTDYDVGYYSAGFTSASGDALVLSDGFTTDADGAATFTTPGTEDADVSISDGALSVDVEIYGVDDLTTSVVGHVDVAACATAGGTTPAPTPATPVAAPVVVTHPAAAQPAVLANTGTPVTTAALLGGGLLVVGAGAVVAGRRRAS